MTALQVEGQATSHPGGRIYARPTYTTRSGDFELEAARAVALELGLAQRLGPVSLVPHAPSSEP